MDDERDSRLAALVLDGGRWVHRRVDTVTFNPDGSMHHRVSFDLTVPWGLPVAGSAGRVILPLALMGKRLRRLRCSGEDPVRGSMRILDAETAARLAVGMLCDLLAESGEAGHTERPPEQVLDRIVRLPGNASSELRAAALGEWDAWRRGATETGADEPRRGCDSPVDELVRALAENELLFAEIDASHVGTRCVLKVSYDSDLEMSPVPGRVRTIRFRVPGFGFAASQHIQADVPFGLTVRELAATETFHGRTLTAARDRPAAGMAHVAIHPSQLTADADIVIRLVASPGRIRSTTIAAVIGVLGLALASILERAHLIHVLAGPLPVPSLGLTVLFGASALDVLWTARTPQHRLAALVQAPLRWVLRLCAVVFLTICFLVTVQVPVWAWEAGWDVVAGVAAAAGVAFTAYARSAAGIGHRSSSHEWASGRTSTL